MQGCEEPCKSMAVLSLRFSHMIMSITPCFLMQERAVNLHFLVRRTKVLDDA